MQRAEDPSRLVPESKEPRAALRPTTAFLFLLLLVAAAGATIYLTRPTPAPTPANTTQATTPDFSLTNEEAIERFEELDSMRHQAFQEADESLLTSIYSPGSEVVGIATREIAQLRRDGVRDFSSFITLNLEVISNQPQEIKLRQVVEVHPRFVTENGADVTDAPESIERTVIWTMSEVEGSWLVQDSVIKRTELTRG